MDPRRITFVPDRFIVSRYLTKICDQLVCLLSSKHSQAIVWDDEADARDDASLDQEKVDWAGFSSSGSTNRVNNKSDVTARQGFTVCDLRLMVSICIDLDHRSW
jgi:hypothetical protein